MSTMPDRLSDWRRASLRALTFAFLACAVVATASPWLSAVEVYEVDRLVRRSFPRGGWGAASAGIAAVLAWALWSDDRWTLQLAGWGLTAAVLVSAAITLATIDPDALRAGLALRPDGGARTYVLQGEVFGAAGIWSLLAGPAILSVGWVLFRLEHRHRGRGWSVPPAVARSVP